MGVDIEQARQALYRFCEGKQRMCIPVQESDDDRIIDRALDELSQARAELERAEQIIDRANMGAGQLIHILGEDQVGKRKGTLATIHAVVEMAGEYMDAKQERNYFQSKAARGE